jgi:hypothetical protein
MGKENYDMDKLNKQTIQVRAVRADKQNQCSMTDHARSPKFLEILVEFFKNKFVENYLFKVI